MPKTIKLSDKLVNEAITHGKAQQRSPSKQIEYWARMGEIAEENPDLPLSFVKDIFIGIEENKTNNVSEYKFGRKFYWASPVRIDTQLIQKWLFLYYQALIS